MIRKLSPSLFLFGSALHGIEVSQKVSKKEFETVLHLGEGVSWVSFNATPDPQFLEERGDPQGCMSEQEVQERRQSLLWAI